MATREQLERLLAAEPNDVFLNFGLAMELAKEVQQEPALRQLDRVLELDPDYCAAYHQKGRLLLALGQADQARHLTAGVQAAKRTGNAHAASQMSELLNPAC